MELPDLIGPYRVERRLGAGGMGEVFLAYSRAGSPVAVKVVRADRLDPHARERFEREAQIARTVIGTNRVARFLNADPFADRPWLAMEYVPGRTLHDHVTEHGVLPVSLVASLGLLVAEGLAAVHAEGLLHRDLKPQNVMLGADGPMIIDFGLGAIVDAPSDSLSQSGDVIGTVRCMPPEQARGRGGVTAAADVYAFGTVLLYAAAGHYPYDGSWWQSIATKVVSPDVEPDLSNLPAVLVPLLTGMLAHDPAARPSLDEVADACAALLDAARTTPMDARLALVALTAGGASLTVPDEPAVPASAGGDADDVVDEVSPLDAPPAAVSGRGGEDEREPGDGAGSGEDRAASVARAGDGSDGSPVPSQRRGRPVAAGQRHPRQVAERLRAQYAVSTHLVSSSR
ncbi:serine/threonine-protein kinase [Pseudofrankia sp. BMG5.37]|uniref:serine/threonine-protein kinase n=1 Tax=Pseudofrankia sp. BMG5.37 TaxID=3050035 RepID=UPI00289605EC|nr:serine/threonine-protein kinase [Pseudofrankia sp. BMG5.37]MDT3444489.1 serine/threonine-protein kinase [Pseudofrankia sp. BMG5.37]